MNPSIDLMKNEWHWASARLQPALRPRAQGRFASGWRGCAAGRLNLGAAPTVTLTEML
jgi:hypothetical protein